MNRIDEYKDKMNWDIWEDIQRVEDDAEEYPQTDQNRPINTESLKRYKKT
jgi:hypothetical protein